MMKVSEAELQSLYRQQTVGSDRQSCLSAEQLTAMARGELGAEERRHAAVHLADCSDCSLELRMARDLEPWAADLAGQVARVEDQPEESLPSEPPVDNVVDLVAVDRHSKVSEPWLAVRRWIPATIAAVLPLVAVSAYLLIPRDLAPESPDGVTPPGDVTRGERTDLLQPAAGAVVDRAPQRFVWPAQLGATGYRLRLYNARAELLWESELLQTNAASLPPTILDELESPGSYAWTVEVEGSVQRSRLGPFSLRIGRE